AVLRMAREPGRTLELETRRAEAGQRLADVGHARVVGRALPSRARLPGARQGRARVLGRLALEVVQAPASAVVRVARPALLGRRLARAHTVEIRIDACGLRRAPPQARAEVTGAIGSRTAHAADALEIRIARVAQR